MSGKESEVRDALRALADEARCAEAPARVEAALVAAFRQQVAEARPVRVWWLPRWAVAAAAGVLLVAGAVTVLHREAPPARAARQEIVTEFFPLVYEPNPAPAEYLQLVRVKLPRPVLGSFGLPVNPERLAEPVQADVILDEVGVARAIRFVSSY